MWFLILYMSFMVVSSVYVVPYHHKSESNHHPSIVPNTSLVRVTQVYGLSQTRQCAVRQKMAVNKRLRDIFNLN